MGQAINLIAPADDAGRDVLAYCRLHGLIGGQICDSVTGLCDQQPDLVLLVGAASSLRRQEYYLRRTGKSILMGLSIDTASAVALTHSFPVNTKFNSLLALKAESASRDAILEAAYSTIRAIVEPSANKSLVAIDFSDIRIVLTSTEMVRVGEAVHVSGCGTHPIRTTFDKMTDLAPENSNSGLADGCLHAQFCPEPSINDWQLAHEYLVERVLRRAPECAVISNVLEDARMGSNESALVVIRAWEQPGMALT